MEDQVQPIRSALESRIGAKIPSSHPIMRRMVEHSVAILNVYTVNISGISPYQVVHGQKAFERRIELANVCTTTSPRTPEQNLTTDGR